ncbi:MAG TPA: LuxR C-terminal-related transcriptional regulator [Jiangellaceae bacterium]
MVVVGVDGSGRTHRMTELVTAAGGHPIRVGPADEAAELRARIAAAPQNSLVLVDDAQRLGGDVLVLLARAARDGVDMVISRRPTLDRPELAELDEAVVAAGGSVTQLAPLGPADIAGLVQRLTGTAPSIEHAQQIHAESAGLPAIAATLASAPSGTVPPALVARVQQRLAVGGPSAAGVARVLALGLDLPDGLLGDASGVPSAELPQIMRLLRDSGLLAPDADSVVPAVATAIKADLSPAELRRVHSDVAHALLASGLDPIVAANQLRAGRVLGPVAADAYRAAGERVCLSEPDLALAWFDDAADAGADPASLSAGRAEAAALLGQSADGLATPSAESDRTRLARVVGAVEAHHGRSHRAVEALLAGGPLGRVLAVPALMSIGHVEQARHAATGEAPAPVHRLAEAAIAVTDPADALPLFIEAAEAAERAAPAAVLPDTPHALGAIVAVTAGDARTGERLLEAAISAGVGGPVAADRHRLLRAWVQMRTGRYDGAIAELRRTADLQLTGRDLLLRAGLAAGIARRSGDVATLREAWSRAEHVLARRAVDLFQIECVEELVVAAARLGNAHRATPVMDALRDIVDRLGPTPGWCAALRWIDLQAGIALDDSMAAARAAEWFAGQTGFTGRQEALRQAAQCWTKIMREDVDRAAVHATADALDAAELPWEASRLAGQAAIRVTDPDDARRLLERARAFAQSGTPSAKSGRTELLSERETEIARLVLAGRTHREIGAQLYVSPKTVEHHVARIRTKLGVRSRAEFVAALRVFLGADDGSGRETPNAL